MGVFISTARSLSDSERTPAASLLLPLDDPRIAPGLLLLGRLQGCLRTLRREAAFTYQLCLARALPLPQGRVLCHFCKSG